MILNSFFSSTAAALSAVWRNISSGVSSGGEAGIQEPLVISEILA